MVRTASTTAGAEYIEYEATITRIRHPDASGPLVHGRAVVRGDPGLGHNTTAATVEGAITAMEQMLRRDYGRPARAYRISGPRVEDTP